MSLSKTECFYRLALLRKPRSKPKCAGIPAEHINALRALNRAENAEELARSAKQPTNEKEN